MCEPAPGPMCSTHARRDLRRASRRYRAAKAAHADAVATARTAAAELDRIRAEADASGLPTAALPDTPEGDWTAGMNGQMLANMVLAGAEGDAHAANNRMETAHETLVEARRSLEAARRDYDVTPAGIDALRAAADVATGREKARATAQLMWARERAAAIQQEWKQSSVYTEQRIARTTTTTALSALRHELTARRCSEHGVVAPPQDHRARSAWSDSPDGTLWARVHAIVGETADLTFMLPLVRDSHDPADVEEAHWMHVPPRWVPTATAAWLARARASQRPWEPTREMLVEAVMTSGEVRVARRGAFVDARRADTWHVAPVTGPLRLPDAALTVTSGWVAVRDRDEAVRALDGLDRFHTAS